MGSSSVGNRVFGVQGLPACLVLACALLCARSQHGQPSSMSQNCCYRRYPGQHPIRQNTVHQLRQACEHSSCRRPSPSAGCDGACPYLIGMLWREVLCRCCMLPVWSVGVPSSLKVLRGG